MRTILTALVLGGLGFWGYVGYVAVSAPPAAPAKQPEQQLAQVTVPFTATLPAEPATIPDLPANAPVKGGIVNWPPSLTVTVIGLHPSGGPAQHVAVVPHKGGGFYSGPIPGTWGTDSTVYAFLPLTTNGIACVGAQIRDRHFILSSPFQLPFTAKYDAQNGFIVTP